MKTLFPRGLALLPVIVAGLICTSPSFSEDAPATQSENANDTVYKGTVTVADAAEKTITVKGTLFSRTFNVGEGCPVALEDKPIANLGDLHVGQKVDVHYQKIQGVLVASRIVQYDQMLNGYITAIDSDKRILAVKAAMSTREFKIAADCDVVLKDQRAGNLENLKVGHSVNVAYDLAEGTLTARKIELKAETFVGTIQALDAGAKTVKARSFLSEKKFNLADGCRIVIADKSDAGLRDLRIGDKVEFSYEDTDGILVVNRIGRDANLTETEGAQTAKVNEP